jgi:UDP-N-acetylmuramoyl-tripeptide--D-alanyl-D-alanine ligase
VLNADVPLLRPHLKLAKTRVLFGESEDADLRLTARGLIDGEAATQWIEINGRLKFELRLPGKHNAINALAAVAVGRRMGLDDDAIAAGLTSVKPDAMRMTPQAIAGMTVFNDAYNANPDSMIAALDTFAELTGPAKRRVVILGDMLELGPTSPELHREIGRHILRIDQTCRIDHTVFIGEQSAFAASEVAKHWPNVRVTVVPALDAKTIAFTLQLLQPDDAVLVKASRGMGLERIIDHITTDAGSDKGRAGDLRKTRIGHIAAPESGSSRWSDPACAAPARHSP